MQVIDPGHVYSLDQLDGREKETLAFVKRLGEKYPGNTGHAHAGTNIQEVLRALIDRVKYLDGQVHDARNDIIINHLRGALLWLEDRAASRHGRSLDPRVWNVDREIEHEPTCARCGHVGCNGACHPEEA